MASSIAFRSAALNRAGGTCRSTSSRPWRKPRSGILAAALWATSRSGPRFDPAKILSASNVTRSAALKSSRARASLASSRTQPTVEGRPARSLAWNTSLGCLESASTGFDKTNCATCDRSASATRTPVARPLAASIHFSVDFGGGLEGSRESQSHVKASSESAAPARRRTAPNPIFGSTTSPKCLTMAAMVLYSRSSTSRSRSSSSLDGTGSPSLPTSASHESQGDYAVAPPWHRTSSDGPESTRTTTPLQPAKPLVRGTFPGSPQTASDHRNRF